MKILAIILGIASIPLLLAGWGVFITVPLFAFAYAMERVTDPKPGQKNNMVLTNVIIVVTGLVCFLGLYFYALVGTSGTQDTVSMSYVLLSLVICTTITAVVLCLVNKRGKASK